MIPPGMRSSGTCSILQGKPIKEAFDGYRIRNKAWKRRILQRRTSRTHYSTSRSKPTNGPPGPQRSEDTRRPARAKPGPLILTGGLSQTASGGHYIPDLIRVSLVVARANMRVSIAATSPKS